jgi:hypothetical protein
MRYSERKFWNRYVSVGRCFDDADESDAGDDAGSETDATKGKTEEPVTTTKKQGKEEQLVPQSKVNEIVARERKALQRKFEDAAKTLEESSKNSEELANQVETLRSTLMTKEELAKKEAQKQKNEFENKVKNLETEANTWKSRYTDSQIEVSILSAAEKNDAFNSSQILSILRPNAKLIEQLDDGGKPTGKMETKIVFMDSDKDGRSIQLELRPDETMKRMKETPETYGNLFKANVATGLGGTSHTSKQPKLPNFSNHEEYVAWRKSQKESK